MNASNTTGTRADEPYVRSFELSVRGRRLFRIGNALIEPILRSRLGARIPDVAVLVFEGRRTGKRYAVPVGLFELDGAQVVTTAAGWRVNLRGGADVEVVKGGETRRRHALLVEDRDEVAIVYAALLERLGVDHADRIGLRIAGDRMPTRDELAEGLGSKRSVIRLTPVR